MAKRFAEHKGLDLVKTNQDMLKEWEKHDIFHKSIDEREGEPQFIFFEGPPSANGHPGIHHVLARSIKDTFNRYKTMRGYQVHRKAGWDTHGLPVELGVEKELGITKKDIDNHSSERYISTEDYNHKCRENVMKFTAEWQQVTEEMGYFVDMEHPYITYDNKYIETLWWLLKQLYNKGLLYKGYTIQPYSPAAGTGLSSHVMSRTPRLRHNSLSPKKIGRHWLRRQTCLSRLGVNLVSLHGQPLLGPYHLMLRCASDRRLNMLSSRLTTLTMHRK
mgnify:CR=1 FL=1